MIDAAALNKARAALVRRCNSITASLGEVDLASVKTANDLTCVLLAIEAVDRALISAGRPYKLNAAAAKPQAQVDSQDEPQTSASRAKERVKAVVRVDRERQPSRRLPQNASE